jgi:hypothetical protein
MIFTKLRRRLGSTVAAGPKTTASGARPNPSPKKSAPGRRGDHVELVTTTDPRRVRGWRPSRMTKLAGLGLSLVLAGCGGAAAGSSSGGQPTTANPAHVTPTIAAKAPQAAGAGTVAHPGTGGGAVTAPAAGAAAPMPTVAAPPAPAPAKAQQAPAKAPAPAAKPANPDAGIPQGGGGDGDPDNAGGPNDGDGAI